MCELIYGSPFTHKFPILKAFTFPLSSLNIVVHANNDFMMFYVIICLQCYHVMF